MSNPSDDDDLEGEWRGFIKQIKRQIDSAQAKNSHEVDGVKRRVEDTHKRLAEFSREQAEIKEAIKNVN